MDWDIREVGRTLGVAPALWNGGHTCTPPSQWTYNLHPQLYNIRNKLFPAQLWDKAKVERKWVQLLL